MELEEILNLPLHTIRKLRTFEEIMRVPGGWIYKFSNGSGTITSQFVPEPINFDAIITETVKQTVVRCNKEMR